MSKFGMPAPEKTITTPTVAEIMASLPRITLDPAGAVEMGRKAYAYLVGGDVTLTEASIDLFATREMLAEAILSFLASEVRASRLTSIPAVAA